MRTVTAAVIALLITLNVARAEVVRITNGEWPPYLSENYNHYGVASHIVTEALKLEGVEVEYGFFPWVRSMEFAKSGLWDATIVWTRSAEREAYFYFSDPVIRMEVVFFHRRDKAFKWSSLEDLRGYRIGGTIGYFYGAEFARLEESKILTISRLRSDEQNLKLLLADRLDLFPIELEVGYEVLRRHFTQQQIDLLTTTRPFRETSYHMLVSKASDKAEMLLNSFNRGLEKLKQSGKFDTMLKSAAFGAYYPVEPSNPKTD
ncbi:hypothetical protein BTA51_14590 [Hahella sp. CCB-MM4]|uniref:substrate-binding periplasmic protein n=1 Tax=Hahella sp. (strain CCB-MM4) TaxID=1926491 RepID=UPI000B9B4F4E|nr:transporter substrate-binding domain-containing protein [Hahella sp. CCB-MM4]OZG72747.1 hypothetical protein BTA51_14590 [Hahella sp. CCB-MM4]